nr:putative ammonium transporter 3 isoform X2 [Procambarus clarkii]XP_045581666.1 putative ammonium transporter 3 isoform X2 [Procambarus clarkii]
MSPEVDAMAADKSSLQELYLVNITDPFAIFGLNGTYNATRNVTSRGGGVFEDTEDFGNDASWILTATFIIFTMQSGFGLLESGCVSMKNETNIMVKNVVDVVLGGFTYWLFGYALSFGKSEWTNPFCGWGDFAINPSEESMGTIYTTFFFQLSFATTATTIVSGAIAERFNFMAYVVFSAVNTIVYCVPAGWLWGSHGFLFKLGAVDIAGSCGVHLCGGSSALVAAAMVGPRIGRYDNNENPLPMGSPTNAILGMFMLWWGWLGFNCGSTFGITGDKWKYAARTAVVTIQSSIGGGLAGMSLSWYKNRRLEIGDVVNSILGALVSITAGCALFTTWEALFVGIVGGVIAVMAMPLFDKLHIDDPVGATSVHGVCGFWAMIAIGLFVKADKLIGLTGGKDGLFRGGGFYLLGIQTLACLAIVVWSTSTTFIILFLVNKFFPIRMTEWEELVGADFAEHAIYRRSIGVSRAVSVLGLEHHGNDYSDVRPQGDNPCHVQVLDNMAAKKARRGSTVSKAVEPVTRPSFLASFLPRIIVRRASADTSNSSTIEVTPVESLEGPARAWT